MQRSNSSGSQKYYKFCEHHKPRAIYGVHSDFVKKIQKRHHLNLSAPPITNRRLDRQERQRKEILNIYNMSTKKI